MNEWELQRRMAERFKQQYPSGTRILLLRMDNDPRPIPPNTRGTVRFVDDMATIHCAFDNGRALGIIPGEDDFRKLTQEELERERAEIRDKPVYTGSLAKARERGEVEQWQESRRLTIECRDAIDEAIRQNYDGRRFRDVCCEEVLEAYNLQRVGLVLAATLRAKPWDGRFSTQNREWTQSALASLVQEKHESELQEYVCSSHSALLDLFANQCREEWEESEAPAQERTEEQDMML